MSVPKRHHYVPRSYLERFVNTETGKLTVYDIEKKEWREQKPSEIMFIRHYNRQEWAPKGVDANILEKRLSDLENLGKNVIDKLIVEPGAIAADEMSGFMVFLEFLRTRVPRQAKFAKQIFEPLIYMIANQIPEIAEALKKGQFKIKVKDKEARIKYMQIVAGSHLPFLLRTKWEIFDVSGGDNTFVTTDSPFSLFNPEIMPPFEAGIGLVGTLVLFPLSPTHLLMCHHPENEKDPSISPTKKIIPEVVQNGHVDITTIKDADENFVIATNRALIELADRYVVAVNKSAIQMSLKRA